MKTRAIYHYQNVMRIINEKQLPVINPETIAIPTVIASTNN